MTADRLITPLRCFAFWCFAATLLALKPLRFLHGLCPKAVREALGTWNREMLLVPFTSAGRRVHVDRPCGFRQPSDYAPRAAAADSRFALTADDVRAFYQQGYLGPFRALPEEEMPALRRLIQERLQSPSPTYGFCTTRDLHLDSPELLRVICLPPIVERVKQLMGPDLLVWRSNVFEKPAGAPEITWHQGTTFLMEQIYKQALEPVDPDDFFEIGIWLAIDDANRANGCVQVLPGTHEKIGTIRLTGTEKFLGTQFHGEYEIDPAKVVDLPCRPGEFLIFSERVIHGSEPNRSSEPRMSFVFRYVKPNCRVYRDEQTHRVMTMKKSFPLEKWACVLVHGEDRLGLNKVVRAEDLARRQLAAAV